MILIQTDIITCIEGEFCSICECSTDLVSRSECILRCLYIFYNLMVAKQWSPVGKTLQLVDSLIQPSDSLSPAVVERALIVKNLAAH